mmetsp:Transcript_28008/g.57379  ORF Transcript_28008/g.57379 Transcript_28008/m.57379 type:complete len:280 (-) Transcript_28008:202-1041(-)
MCVVGIERLIESLARGAPSEYRFAGFALSGMHRVIVGRVGVGIGVAAVAIVIFVLALIVVVIETCRKLVEIAAAFQIFEFQNVVSGAPVARHAVVTRPELLAQAVFTLLNGVGALLVVVVDGANDVLADVGHVDGVGGGDDGHGVGVFEGDLKFCQFAVDDVAIRVAVAATVASVAVATVVTVVTASVAAAAIGSHDAVELVVGPRQQTRIIVRTLLVGEVVVVDVGHVHDVVERRRRAFRSSRGSGRWQRRAVVAAAGVGQRADHGEFQFFEFDNLTP